MALGRNDGLVSGFPFRCGAFRRRAGGIDKAVAVRYISGRPEVVVKLQRARRWL